MRRLFRGGAAEWTDGLGGNPAIGSKLVPLAGRDNAVVLAPGGGENAVPPPERWEGYADSPEDFLVEGRADMDNVMALLARHGIARPRVAMDLGCAAARMLRHFPRDERSELWGVDINAAHIAWCQRNHPDINFVTTTTAPHLPFPDGQFDFVFCGSVFTHITDLADAWLLEIRRILKPGGHLYATIHDQTSFRELLTIYAHWPGEFPKQVKAFDKRHRPLERPCDMFYFGADPASQVFYDRDYITAKWSKWMDVLAYEPQFHNYQSAMLLRKRAG